MSLVRKYGMKLETDFVSVILSVGILEGLARSLDPEIDLGELLNSVISSRSPALINGAVVVLFLQLHALALICRRRHRPSSVKR